MNLIMSRLNTLRTKCTILWRMRWLFRSLPKTVYFNIRYLPIQQALKLPILLYKPHFVALKGQIKINGPVHFGMIHLGQFSSNVHPNNGISWENRGGIVTFNGTCFIGNATYLSIGPNAVLHIGDNVRNASGLRIVCYKKISIGNNVRFGWGVMLIDTNFHPLIEEKTGKIKRASGPIIIEDKNWFGLECLVMHSVKIPPRCIFGARTVITRNCEMESYCVTITSPQGRIVTRGVYRDLNGPNDLEREDL